MAQSSRSARRRAEKLRKKQKKISPQDRQKIVEVYWRDAWHFDDLGLTVRNRITNRVIKFFPGV